MNSIDAEFVKKHPRSQELANEQRKLLPDGVAHDCRHLEPFPIFIDHAAGPRKWDVDENEYVCLTMGHGALILGHAHPSIVTAIQQQVAKGTHYGFNSELETRWAKAIKRLVPSIEKLRFHSSGTEATMMALRLSRAYTGRSKFVKFTTHFHGWHDSVSVAAERYSSAGISPHVNKSVIVLPIQDTDAFERTLANDPDIAAVILEPSGAKGGALAITPELVRTIREITERHNVVLIFDEIITGFRSSKGGVQGKWGIVPDLTTLGKVVAGGLPGACVGGSAEIIDMIQRRSDDSWNSTGRVAHPGTFNANPLSATAGFTCLEMIAAEPIVERTHEAALTIRSELNRVLHTEGVSGLVHGHGSDLFLVFDVDYEGELGESCAVPHEAVLKSIGSHKKNMFRKAMLNHGVDVMNGYWLVCSSVLGQAEIGQIVTAFEQSIREMKACELF